MCAHARKIARKIGKGHHMSKPDSAAAFHALHQPGNILVLANCWDAASARLAEESGAKAIATSSASLAWCHGFADGQALPKDVFLAAVREIIAAVRIPVTVDNEAGFSDDPDEVVKFVGALGDAGAVGINLEDGKRTVALHASKIAAVKKAFGKDIFINARTDVYLQKLVTADKAAGESIARAKTYADAGADGIFVPAVIALDEIVQIAKAVSLPLNVLALKGVAPVAALKDAGVRRLSAGAGPGRAAYGAAFRAMTQLYSEGRYDAMFAEMEGLGNLNALLTRA